RDDRCPAGGQGVDKLALRAHEARNRVDELEVNGTDVRDDSDLRPSDLCKRGDLSEAAHRELQDADLGVLLEPAERERHADLVVVAGFGGDRANGRSAERGEDV